MKAITFDPSRSITMYARRARAGLKNFRFRKTDGSPFELVGYEFEFFVKKYLDSDDKMISIDLQISGDYDNELAVELTAEDTDVDPGTFHWQIVNKTNSRTWLNGPFKLHTGNFDAFNEDLQDITINLEGEVVEVTINDAASRTGVNGGTVV